MKDPNEIRRNANLMLDVADAIRNKMPLDIEFKRKNHDCWNKASDLNLAWNFGEYNYRKAPERKRRPLTLNDVGLNFRLKRGDAIYVPAWWSDEYICFGSAMYLWSDLAKNPDWTINYMNAPVNTWHPCYIEE